MSFAVLVHPALVATLGMLELLFLRPAWQREVPLFWTVAENQSTFTRQGGGNCVCRGRQCLVAPAGAWAPRCTCSTKRQRAQSPSRKSSAERPQVHAQLVPPASADLTVLDALLCIARTRIGFGVRAAESAAEAERARDRDTVASPSKEDAGVDDDEQSGRQEANEEGGEDNAEPSAA